MLYLCFFACHESWTDLDQVDGRVAIRLPRRPYTFNLDPSRVRGLAGRLLAMPFHPFHHSMLFYAPARKSLYTTHGNC